MASSITIYMPDSLRELVKGHIPTSMSLSKFIQAVLVREIVEPADIKKYADGLHFLDIPHIGEQEFKSLMMARCGETVETKTATSPVEPVNPIPAPAPKSFEPVTKSRRSGVGTGKNQIGY
jgi:hypothetical protein